MLVKEEGKSEYSTLDFLGIAGSEYVHGHEYELKVRKTTLANPPMDDSNVKYMLLEVIKDIPHVNPQPSDPQPVDPQPTDPQPGELPEEAEFQIKMVQLTPFMDPDTPLAAPFDHLTFRILNHKGEYSYFSRPDFLDYYDLIEMSSPDMPDTYCVYKTDKDESGENEHFTSQWGSHFYGNKDFRIYLKGYKRRKNGISMLNDPADARARFPWGGLEERKCCHCQSEDPWNIQRA